MDHSFRFGGVARLYGESALQQFQKSRVAIIGVGGVGSWAVEALARSGIGELHLMDMDDICESNINRQLQALDGNIGRAKIEVLAERIRSINPDCKVHCHWDFFSQDTQERLFQQAPDLVLDCIDGLKNKSLLVASCIDRKLKIISCGGAGGKTDPRQICIDDLAKTEGDPLLAKLRKKLRQDYGFKKLGPRFGIPCVFSREARQAPQSCESTTQNTKLDCATGYGAVTHLTGSFGFFMAAAALESLLSNQQKA